VTASIVGIAARGAHELNHWAAGCGAQDAGEEHEPTTKVLLVGESTQVCRIRTKRGKGKEQVGGEA
jgi:hypothetical protein